jgi:hypothetical protein
MPAQELRHLRHLLTLMSEGERLAADCARAQSRMTDDAREARFFRAQARQEALHAAIFDGGVGWLGGPVAPSALLAAYRRRLEAALEAGRLATAVTGTQVVLEALGHTVLQQIDAAMTRGGWGLARLRRLVLGQEAAHQRFGERYLAASPARMAEGLDAARPFLALAGDLIDASAPILDGLALQPGAFRTAFLHDLPAGVRSAA